VTASPFGAVVNAVNVAITQRGGEHEQFLHFALGSASELDTQLEIAMRVDLAKPAVLEKLQASTTRVGQMLCGLARSLRQKDGA